MIQHGLYPSRHGLDELGIQVAAAHWNLGTAQLLERAICHAEGALTKPGAFAVRTGQFTGRSPKDKFIVRDAVTEDTVAWGSVNQPLATEHFDGMYARLLAFLKDQEVYVQDLAGGAAADYRLPVRVITQRAWHALFARRLFIRPAPEQLAAHQPRFTLLFAPDFQANPVIDGTRSETAIVVNFTRRLVLILGTSYAGELKKSLFTLLNYLLPERDVLPMHCSANIGAGGRVALFFGLSGTGKTTLSADPHRNLIGDDEHGWSGTGVFNFEGGCYAKCIRLSREAEPQIYNAIRYGSVLENVDFDPLTREIDYDSDKFTENTRAAYPVEFIDNAVLAGTGGLPTDVVFLTADAFGVLPPIAKLTPEQAMYHFLSGYTAKLAGTERGLSKDPEAVFSSCFGEPFLPRSPLVYARMLGEKLRKTGAHVWLVNTGWTGGAFGTGHRMSIAHTRALVNAAVDGALVDVPCKPHPVFKVLVPERCPGVPAEVLDPRRSWPDQEAYDRAARALAVRFHKNFTAKFGSVGPDIAAAGPLA